MKPCAKCNVLKSLDCFYKQKMSRDGHAGKCIECCKIDAKQNYRNNIDQYKAYEKSRANLPHRVKARADYAKTEQGIKAGNKAKKKWCDKNPIKYKAVNMVGNAVRDGKLIKPNECESCGQSEKRVCAHHDDYAKPLSVRWLCDRCHRQWHAKHGEGKNSGNKGDE